MKDSIFLILSTNNSPWDPWGKCDLYRIYENVENNGTMKWSYIGNFGETKYDLLMPPVIQSIESGKFFLFPQEIKGAIGGTESAINMKFVNPIQLWTKNKNLTQFWGQGEFPKSLRPNKESSTLFILQI